MRLRCLAATLILHVPPAVVAAVELEGAAPTSPLPSGPLELDSKPRRVAVLQPASGGLEVLLLFDSEMARYRIERGALARVGGFRPPVPATRGLHLDASSGAKELVAAVFARDVLSIDQGTDSRLHAWILEAGQGGLRTASDDLQGYARVVDGTPYLQRRGEHAAFTGSVRRLVESAGQYAASGEPVPWAGRWLLDATPMTPQASLAWGAGSRPLVLGTEGGARLPGGSIAESLGAVPDPAVSVRLERPEFRLGLDKEGRVAAVWQPLPRRVVVTGPGVAYTIERVRSKGLPVFGRPSGEDAVVRLAWEGNRVTISRPFPGVKAFVLDFAVVHRPGKPPGVLLLLNDEEDASGGVRLLYQEPL